LNRISHFCPGWPGPQFSYCTSCAGAMAGMHGSTQVLLAEMSFCLGWPRAMILAVSSSCVAEITGVSH
jgi:hypothetical protein